MHDKDIGLVTLIRSLRFLGRFPARARSLLQLGSVLTFTGAYAPGPTRPAAQPSLAATAPVVTPLVFDGVTVIDVQQGRRLLDQRVVIVGNRIRTMGSVHTVRVPAGARVVDARGKYLIPGLWDMHAHPMLSSDIFYPLFIANGVTGIRDASSPVPLDTLHLWRREILAGTRVGPPRQILVGKALDDTSSSPSCKEKESPIICVADPATARHIVDSLQAAGADMIKAHHLTKMEVYFALASESRRVGIPFGGHLERATKITAMEASDSGAKILDHMSSSGDLGELCLEPGSSVERCRLVAERFRRNGTWWVPTIQLGQIEDNAMEARVRNRDAQFKEAFWAGATLRNGWLQDSASGAKATVPHNSSSTDDTARQGTLQTVHRVGLPILAGTDESRLFWHMMLPGFTIHTELALYQAEGLTPLEALQTATLNPAKLLHGTDSLGTVAPGKLADLVLLDADPLVDVANTTAIRAVVANGRYYDRAALNKLESSAQANAINDTTKKILGGY